MAEVGQDDCLPRISIGLAAGDEPYYPISNEKSAALLAKYQAEAAKLPCLVIGGRLGQYKYFDMDKSVNAALKTKGEASQW